MDLETRNVYIDTQAFINMGLNFDHIALQNFLRLCRDGLLVHYMTSVVEREVRSHIEEAIVNAISSLKTFQRKAKLLKNLDSPEFAKYFQPIDEKLIKDNAQTTFSKFLDEAQSKLISSKDISIEDLLNSYFERLPPFNNKNKKSEFPDAISLASLASKLNDEKIYIISGDRDYSSFCEANDQFIHIGQLDRFLDIYNRHENALTNLITTEIDNSKNEIIKEIITSFSNMGIFNCAPWEGSEVVEFEVESVDDIESSVIYINDKKSIAMLDFDVTYTATVSGPDFLNGTYDSEDKCVYAFNTTTNTATNTQSFSAEVEFYFTAIDGALNNVKRRNLRLINGNYDIEIYVSEYDEY